MPSHATSVSSIARVKMHMFINDEFKALQRCWPPTYTTPADINDLLVRMYMLGKHLRIAGHTVPGLGQLADVGLYRNTGEDVPAPMKISADDSSSSSLSATAPPLNSSSSTPAPTSLCFHAQEAFQPTYPDDDVQKMLRRQDRMREMDAWYTSRQWEALEALERDLKAHYEAMIALMEQRHAVDQQQVDELTSKLIDVEREQGEVEARLAQYEAKVAAMNSVHAEWTQREQALLNENTALKHCVERATQQLNNHETMIDSLKGESDGAFELSANGQDVTLRAATLLETEKQKQALLRENESLKTFRTHTTQQLNELQTTTHDLKTENSRLADLSKQSHIRELEYRDAIARLNNEKATLSTKFKDRETHHEATTTALLTQMTTLRSQNRRVDDAAKQVLAVCKSQTEQIQNLQFELNVATAALSSKLTIPKQRHPALTNTSTPPTSRTSSGGSVIYHEPPSAGKEKGEPQSFTHIELRVKDCAAAAVPAKRKLSRVVSGSEREGEDVLEAVVSRLRERVKKVKQGGGGSGAVVEREVSVCSEGSLMDWTVCG